MTELKARDLRQLQEHGISAAEAERQLDLLRNPPAPRALVRPCELHDGIVAFSAEEQAGLRDRFSPAIADGRVSKFVPASGAASRMFKTLLAAAELDLPTEREDLATTDDNGAGGNGAREDLLTLMTEIGRFPFQDELRDELDRHDLPSAAEIGPQKFLAVLLGSGELDLAGRAKALIPFHSYSNGARTALVEHMAEARGYIADESGRCRVHFTVSPDHREAFEAAASKGALELEQEVEGEFTTTFSSQEAATDTLALDGDSHPFRDSCGELMLRPGGHGALIRNLSSMGGDVVFIKNIDNILPEARHGLIAHWQGVLGGLVLDLEEQTRTVLEALEDDCSAETLDDFLRFASSRLNVPAAVSLIGGDAAEIRAFLLDRLNRPLRACGVVESSGEPGGGPFWVRQGGEESVQIVESAEVAESPEQQQIFASSTHFNPVQIVCSLRDRHGESFDLDQFVDRRAVFIARKSAGGRELVALEHPGLWNGGMAAWNTVFVEVPAETFAPVKTVFDLLRPEHQPPQGSTNCPRETVGERV